MRNKKYPLITVIGNVGSGKSTVSKFLAKSFNAHLVSADELYKTNPFFQDTIVDRSRWSLASDLWFLLKRIELTEQLQTKLHTRSVIQDSGLLMSWVYANSRLNQGYMNRKEQEIYTMVSDKLTTKIPQESLIIYLDLPIQTLLKRIRKRGRNFEIKFHTQLYLSALETSLKRLVIRLKQSRTPVLIYSEHNWPNVLCNTTHQQMLTKEVTMALT